MEAAERTLFEGSLRRAMSTADETSPPPGVSVVVVYRDSVAFPFESTAYGLASWPSVTEPPSRSTA